MCPLQAPVRRRKKQMHAFRLGSLSTRSLSRLVLPARFWKTTAPPFSSLMLGIDRSAPLWSDSDASSSECSDDGIHSSEDEDVLRRERTWRRRALERGLDPIGRTSKREDMDMRSGHLARCPNCSGVQFFKADVGGASCSRCFWLITSSSSTPPVAKLPTVISPRLDAVRRVLEQQEIMQLDRHLRELQRRPYVKPRRQERPTPSSTGHTSRVAGPEPIPWLPPRTPLPIPRPAPPPATAAPTPTAEAPPEPGPAEAPRPPSPFSLAKSSTAARLELARRL